MASSFFYSKNCSRSVLAKNWRFCRQLAASACQICFCVALSSIVPAHFPNQISKGRGWIVRSMVEDVDLPMIKILSWCKDGLLHTSCLLVSCLVTEWPPDACKLYPSGGQSHANCTRVAVSRMQISADFIHVASRYSSEYFFPHPTLFQFMYLH